MSNGMSTGQTYVGRVPKLTYRNPLPKDETLDTSRDGRATTPRSPIDQGQGLIINTTSNRLSDTSVSSTASPPTPKKKSFFTGLFAKEPTMIALAQVEADLKAKHGAATAQKVPHVSSQKMPDYVPKVNSKWDGIPDATKARDKDQTKTRRQSCQGSINLQDSISSGYTGRSTNDSTWRSSRRISDTDSYLYIWQQQDKELERASPATSTYTESIRSSNGTHSKKASSARTHSFHSPSESSLQNFKTEPSYQEDGFSELKEAHESGLGTTRIGSLNKRSQKHLSLPRSTAADHNSMLALTPAERSPVTPAYETDEPIAQVLTTSGNIASTKHRPLSLQVAPESVFLAGEAKPLTLSEANYQKSDLPLRQYVPNDDTRTVKNQLHVPVQPVAVVSPNRSRFPKAKALFKERK